MPSAHWRGLPAGVFWLSLACCGYSIHLLVCRVSADAYATAQNAAPLDDCPPADVFFCSGMTPPGYELRGGFSTDYQSILSHALTADDWGYFP